jgi:hypothetical protein
MSTSLFKTIFLISVASAAIPLLVFIWRWKHQPSQNRIIAILLVCSIISDLVSWWLTTKGTPTYIVENIYIVFAFILLNGFYYLILFQKEGKKILLIVSCIFAIMLIIVALITGFGQVDSRFWVLCSGILAFNSILYFCSVPSMIVERYFDKYLFSNLVLNASFLLYFFTSIILFIFMDFVFSQLTPNEARSFWSIHNIINVLKNVGIALAFFLSGKRNVYMTFSQLERIGRDQAKQRELMN